MYARTTKIFFSTALLATSALATSLLMAAPAHAQSEPADPAFLGMDTPHVSVDLSVLEDSGYTPNSVLPPGQRLMPGPKAPVSRLLVPPASQQAMPAQNGGNMMMTAPVIIESVSGAPRMPDPGNIPSSMLETQMAAPAARAPQPAPAPTAPAPMPVAKIKPMPAPEPAAPEPVAKAAPPAPPPAAPEPVAPEPAPVIAKAPEAPAPAPEPKMAEAPAPPSVPVPPVTTAEVTPPPAPLEAKPEPAPAPEPVKIAEPPAPPPPAPEAVAEAPAAPPPAPEPEAVVEAPAQTTPSAMVQIPPAEVAAPTPEPEQQAALTTGEPLTPGRVLGVIFAPDASKLPDSARTELKSIAARLQQQDSLRLQLLAYAGGGDMSSSAARRLSLSRALEVRSFLIENGIRSTRIDVRALGNKTTEAEPNRVDINVIER